MSPKAARLDSEASESPEPVGEHEEAPAHFVQFFGTDDRILQANVTRFLLEGLAREENVIVVATRAHSEAFQAGLRAAGINPDDAVEQERLTLLDARQTLGSFMIAGRPDRQLFELAVEPVLRRALNSSNPSGVRAYGEMVGILWEEGNLQAAIELENHWNRLVGAYPVSLFCAYPIDLLDNRVPAVLLNAVLRDHSHMLPAGPNGDLERAISGAMDQVLGLRGEALREQIRSHYRPSCAAMPAGEMIVFWLKNNLPDQADEILRRARAIYCTPSTSFSTDPI